jgi:hypothetical protein
MATPDYSRIESCLDVTDDHIREALAAARTLNDPSPREKALALLRHMAKIARPGKGAARILLVLGKMAKRDWLDGDLLVKLIGDSELTVLELMIDDGASLERMLGPLKLDVPLSEFTSAVQRNRAALLPLEVEESDGRRLVLRGLREHRKLARKASISAFDVDLVRGFSSSAAAAKPATTGASETGRKPPGPPPLPRAAAPKPGKAGPPPLPPPRKKSS